MHLNCGVGEDSWESLDCKEIQPVHSEGISLGISLEGMMLKLKLQYFGHLMWRVDSLEKTDAGRDWEQEEKGTTEDEMAGWRHRLDGHEPEWTPGIGDGQGVLACCDSWGRKESDTTEQLNWMLPMKFWNCFKIYIFFTSIRICCECAFSSMSYTLQ